MYVANFESLIKKKVCICGDAILILERRTLFFYDVSPQIPELENGNM
jgi:hypothetical protein